MFTTFFKKNHDNSDVFKKLIHRLSDMSVQDLEKIRPTARYHFHSKSRITTTKNRSNLQRRNFGRHIKGSKESTS